MAIIETQQMDSRLDRVRKLLAKAESVAAEFPAEAEALNERAAQLIADYGIDRAMLAASGQEADPITDKVIIVVRPFGEQMNDLLWRIASPLRAKATMIKRWNTGIGPKTGGKHKGGWEFGLRIFAHESDMARIEMLYTSLRNQALKGAAQIVDTSTEFCQAQKAERVSYLSGFSSAIYWRLERLEREAQKAREAAEQELADEAMLRGEKPSAGVVAVLDNRKAAVDRAYDRAMGITAEDRIRWASRREEDTARWEQEKAECKRCLKDLPCSKHGTAKGRPTTERKGSHWNEGWADGNEASIGSESEELEQDGPAELE